MQYNLDTPVVISQTENFVFNPGGFDCSHPNSPAYKQSMFPLLHPYAISGPGGPQAITPPASRPHGIPARDSSPPSVAYLPPTLRELPFMPPAPAPMAQCDPSMPDVFQTVHTNAQVTRISTCPFQIKAQIPVVTRPLQIQITPDGSTALVTSFDHAVNFIDVASNRVIYELCERPIIMDSPIDPA